LGSIATPTNYRAQIHLFVMIFSAQMRSEGGADLWKPVLIVRIDADSQ